MGFQARFAASKASNRRYSQRRTLQLQASVAGDEDVIIHDISHTGLLLETSTLLTERQALNVELPEVGIVEAKVVWRSSRFIGCRFTHPIPQAAISAALLRNPITRAEPQIDDRAWEALGSAVDQTEESASLSFGAKLRVILGMSVLLWAAIFWALGVF